MTFQFRPAVRESVGLLIGLAGGTGSGKTFSGFRLAAGISGDKPFAVIDTESRRALHYADKFRFDHAELRAPFSPDAYAEAIMAADAAGYPVIMVDSMSHEWAGDGGVLDMQEAEFERMGGRETAKIASWIKPKIAHKKMVSTILQVRAHLILNFRAEPKIEIGKENGKTVIKPKESLTGYNGWIPITEKNLPFELTVSFMMTAENPGVGLPIKLQDQHKDIFPAGKLIDEECGRRIAAWAAGGESKPPMRATAAAATSSPASAPLDVSKLVSAFGEIRVTTEMLARKLGHGIDSITEDEASGLRSVFQAIKQGAHPVEYFFPRV